MASSSKKIATALACGWTLLFLIVLFYCDLQMPALMENSDFTSSIYSGAKLFALNRQEEIYAPSSAVTFTKQPADIAAHQFLPGLNRQLVAGFVYSPLVAFLLAPLTYLGAQFALLAWHVLSILAIAAAVWLLAPQTERSRSLQFCAVFLPIPVALWIGQLDLIFGVLFYALGYYLSRQNKPLQSGLVFALACLKPQFIVVPGLLALVSLGQKQWRFTAGFTAGLAVILLLNIIVASPALFQQWLGAVALYEKLYTANNNGLAEHLFVSLPGRILRGLAAGHFAYAKLVTYALAGVLGLTTAGLCLRFCRASGHAVSGLAFTFISGLFLMPLVLPVMQIYDLSLYVLAALICLDPLVKPQLPLANGKFLIAGALAITSYTALLIAARQFANPILIIFILATLYCFWLSQSRRTSSISN